MKFSINLHKKAKLKAGSEKEVKALFTDLPADSVVETNPSGNWILWMGDAVLPDGFSSLPALLKSLNEQFDLETFLKTGGSYYCFRYDAKSGKLFAYTGFLNIMPIYYYNGDEFSMASAPQLIAEKVKVKFTPSKRYILERQLFNYPFGNSSIYNEISMLGGNENLCFDGQQLQIEKHTRIQDWFIKNPIPVKESLDYLSDVFNERTAKYFPDEEFYLSFTSGFDGRTVLSLALKEKVKFVAYSFGVKHYIDITLPLKQSKELGLPYKPFYLDELAYISKSLDFGYDLVETTGTLANIARAQYVYAIEQLSKDHKYLVTGNFGSELFRAFNNAGVLVTKFLVGLFQADNLEEFLEKYPYDELKYLNRDEFTTTLDGLKSDLLKNDLFKKDTYSKNERLYIFVFEDIFRKYFGAELSLQSNYMYNRTPFIDYQLVKEVLKSELAGVYSDFYESNPVNRRKGQLLYAHVIKKNSPQLFNMVTGKGYRPADLIQPFGKAMLVFNLLKKGFKKSRIKIDPMALRTCYRQNIPAIESAAIDERLFNKETYLSAVNGDLSDINELMNAISINWFVNKHFKA